jgi:hypothetical protein
MSVVGYYSHLYLHSLPIDKMRSFNISLVPSINIIISVLNNSVKGKPLPHFFQILPFTHLKYSLKIVATVGRNMSRTGDVNE